MKTTLETSLRMFKGALQLNIDTFVKDALLCETSSSVVDSFVCPASVCVFLKIHGSLSAFLVLRKSHSKITQGVGGCPGIPDHGKLLGLGCRIKRQNERT